MSGSPKFQPVGEWRKYQRQQSRFKPLTPEAVLPDTARTEKRIMRSVNRELAQPRLAAVPVPEPEPPVSEPPESLRAKLVRLGWQSESGTSLEWRYWNQRRFRTNHFDSPALRALQDKE